MSKLDDFNPKQDLSVKELMQYLMEKRKMQKFDANVSEVMKAISKMVEGLDFVLIVSGTNIHSVASTLTPDDLITELAKALEQSKENRDNFEHKEVNRD